MVVQCHNGNIYALKKTADIPFNLTKDTLFLVLLGIKSANKDKSDIEIGEVFVKAVANAMRWEFMKGDNRR